MVIKIVPGKNYICHELIISGQYCENNISYIYKKRELQYIKTKDYDSVRHELHIL